MISSKVSIEQLFFELLQVSIGNRRSLSHAPSPLEWKKILETSKKQALAAVAFLGVSRLREHIASSNSASDGVGIDEATHIKWLGLTVKIAQRNKQLNEECTKVCAELAHDGIQCCVLKGQSNLMYYPENLRECRTPGDIDLWTLPHPEGIPIAVSSNGSAEYVSYKGIEGIVEYAQQVRRVREEEPIPWEHILYYHVETTTDSGIFAELHYRPSFLCSPLRNHRLQIWFKENEPWGMCDANIGGNIFPVLPVSTNAVYQLLHIYKHLFEEGIGLRQLLDYYFVLRALHIEQGDLSDRTPSMAQWAEGMGIAVKSNEEIMHTLNRFGMKKFAGAVMYVLAKVFDSETKTIKTPNGSVSVAVSENSSELDLSATASSTGSNPASIQPSGYKQEKHIAKENWQTRWPWMICKPNEKEGKFLLNEIMMAGNFGKFDERIKHDGGQFSHAIEKTKHNLRLLNHYPEEVIFEPFFRLYHWLWRKFRLWRW